MLGGQGTKHCEGPSGQWVGRHESLRAPPPPPALLPGCSRFWVVPIACNHNGDRCRTNERFWGAWKRDLTHAVQGALPPLGARREPNICERFGPQRPLSPFVCELPLAII